MKNFTYQIENLQLAYPQHPKPSPLSFTIQAGQTWVVLGQNGAGKTSLLMNLAGIQPSLGGSLEINGQPLASLAPKERAKLFGLVTQETANQLPNEVINYVLAGRFAYLKSWQAESFSDYRLALTALKHFNLLHLKRRNHQNLSGGEKQRLNLATLFCQNPWLYILDEPTNHLDLAHQVQLVTQLQAKTKQQHSLVLALHNPNLALKIASHAVLFLPSGEVLTGKAEDVLSLENLEAAYQIKFNQEDTNPLSWL